MGPGVAGREPPQGVAGEARPAVDRCHASAFSLLLADGSCITSATPQYKIRSTARSTMATWERVPLPAPRTATGNAILELGPLLSRAPLPRPRPGGPKRHPGEPGIGAALGRKCVPPVAMWQQGTVVVDRVFSLAVFVSEGPLPSSLTGCVSLLCPHNKGSK